MCNDTTRATNLIVSRMRELAHLFAIEHEWTSLIESRRQLERETRIPQREKQSVHYEAMRALVMDEARLIEDEELPALVKLLEKAIRNE